MKRGEKIAARHRVHAPIDQLRDDRVGGVAPIVLVDETKVSLDDGSDVPCVDVRFVVRCDAGELCGQSGLGKPVVQGLRHDRLVNARNERIGHDWE